MAVMRGSSSRASMASSLPRLAWLPTVIMLPSRRPRCWNVRFTPTLPLCDTMATPRSKRPQPCSSGHSATRSKVFTKP